MSRASGAPGSAGSDHQPSPSRERARPQGTPTQLLATVIEIHTDVQWLKLAVQALLDHLGLSIDQPRSRTRISDDTGSV